MEWKAIAYPREGGNNVVKSTTSNKVSEKGNFVVYTIDKRRFVLPLSYLSNHIFQELFKISEEEFGLSSSEPITLPYPPLDTEKALLNSIITRSCSMNACLHQGQTSPQLLLWIVLETDPKQTCRPSHIHEGAKMPTGCNHASLDHYKKGSMAMVGCHCHV
ncbi:hypothetical protein DVH24_004909 [Malus domestica]|uniref:Uncharacterized protein n=1 Tax=Malus domestica TaxID=3750 RepID=A0A498IFU3_MALDO|nr:hypothetical protein DVH24_004909 [Malus domestica]